MSLGELDEVSKARLRELAPRVLAVVARRYGDFAAAEDAVQEALVSAAVEWARAGLPDNPGGWLHHVACRRMEDHRASERARRRREERVAAQRDEAHIPLEGERDDDALQLLFTCCHPALSDASAVALTLRAVGGLTTAEIASAFVTPEPTMAQRISRAKQTIVSSGAALTPPSDEERESRLSAVLHVIYLMFNEGYAASSGAEVARVELSSEAIRLARLLVRLQPGHGETLGLLALMLLTDARRGARTGASGALVPLDEQDRSRWDRARIAEGVALLSAAFARGVVGSYQIQAAIAALHDEAPSFEATDWPQILALYGLLMRLGDNPMVALNHAVAVAMVRGPAEGLKLVDELERGGRLAARHRIDAVRAHLLERAGDARGARRCYLAAAERTSSNAEREHLLRKADRLAP